MKAITLNDVRAQMSGTAFHAIWSICLPLVDAIEARAGVDPEYAADLALWLTGERSTIHLRDTLCEPLRNDPVIVAIGKKFNPTTEWDNTWMPLDSSAHRARQGISPEDW